MGYARVSTAEQNPAHQIDALHRAGVGTDDIHVDHASGAASAASEKAARSAAAIRPGNRCATGYLLGSNLAILLRTAVSCSAARLLLSVLAL